MKRQSELIRLPTIYDCGGRFSLKDKWFIEFYVRNPRSGKMERFRKAKGINKFHNLKARNEAAEKMKQYWREKLKAGWSPFSDDQEVFYTQTLTLEEANYFSNIWIKNEDELIPFVSSEGVYTVIDNTLTGQFISFGKANENNQMVYYNSSSNDVSLQVIEKLNIHPNFIGTFFAESNSLTLRLDMDGDGSISGDEGKSVFKRIVH